MFYIWLVTVRIEINKADYENALMYFKKPRKRNC